MLRVYNLAQFNHQKTLLTCAGRSRDCKSRLRKVLGVRFRWHGPLGLGFRGVIHESPFPRLTWHPIELPFQRTMALSGFAFGGSHFWERGSRVIPSPVSRGSCFLNPEPESLTEDFWGLQAEGASHAQP